MMKKMMMIMMVLVGMVSATFAKDYYYRVKNGDFGRSSAEFFESNLKHASTIVVTHKGNINRHELVENEYALIYEFTTKSGDEWKFIKLVTNEKDGE